MKNFTVTLGQLFPNLPALFGKKSVVAQTATNPLLSRRVDIDKANKAYDQRQKEAAYLRAAQSKQAAARAQALEAKHGFHAACMASRTEIGASVLQSQAERMAELKGFAVALGQACKSFFQNPTLEAGEVILQAVKGLKWLTWAMLKVIRRVELLLAKLIAKAISTKAIATSIPSFVMGFSWVAVQAAQEVDWDWVEYLAARQLN